jgi:drug/metabolite transporter (DMT)-like permease
VVAAGALAAYYLIGEHAVGSRDPVSLTCWSMFFAAVFWSIAQPWWSFDPGVLGRSVSLLGNAEDVTLPVWVLLIYIVVGGTMIPFSLSMLALRHLPATVVGAVAMLEPVLAGAVAWVWLRESLAPVQLVGSFVVICGIALAQTARGSAAPVEIDVPRPAEDRPQPAPTAG